MGRVRVNCPYCGETTYATVPNNADFVSARRNTEEGDARSTSRCSQCDSWFRSNYDFNEKVSDSTETVSCPQCGKPVDVEVPSNVKFYSTRMRSEQGDQQSTITCPNCDGWFRFNYTA